MAHKAQPTSPIMPAVEVLELQGESAQLAYAETLSAGLELAPLPVSDWDQKLQRAGFAPKDSGRRELRAEVTP